MLDGKTIKVKIGGDFPTVPMDKYTVQITDVNEKTKVFNGSEEYGLNYELTILDNKTFEVDGQPESLRGRKVWAWVSAKLSPKSNLGKLIQAVYGRELSKAELEQIDNDGFQAEDLINKQIDVVVEVNEGTGKNAGRSFNNVTAFSKCRKELLPLENDKYKVGEPRKSQPVEDLEDSVAPDKNDDFIAGLEKDRAKEQA